ncbi:secretion protein HlyD family protein [Clostridium sp. DL-VIII]|uniref:HlyD family secretion protein n=1 Tax=Clostridium sp. DL-VIII TaxID=641107 RepID=UPI00023AFDC5|nr:efflux RND transporter periplasmic adaptor subunit [Clostridium sp. DL-VIII]EHI98393.1 secretion protein HlyD family protein [Clostridium sp. DL-VIII]
MKIRNITILVVLLFVTNAFTGCVSLFTLTGDKLVKQTSNDLIVQSNVDMTDVNVNTLIPGKVKEVKVKEGDSVKKGDVLLVIDSDTLAAQQAQVQAQIETAKSQLSAAQAARDAASAKLEEAQNGARPEEIDQAKSAYDLAKITSDRLNVLYQQGSITKSDLDNAETQTQVAKDKYDLVQKGARPEDIKAAQAQVDQANASVESVQGQIKQAEAALQGVNVNLDYATVTAPEDGTMTQVNVEEGETVSTGMQLAVVTKTNEPSILCNVRENDLSKVDLNQDVSVKIPAYNDETFKGKVVRINKDADFAVKRATNDNGEFDVLSYGVKIELADNDKAFRSGMTAFVDFGK